MAKKVRRNRTDRIRLFLILVTALLVISTSLLFSVTILRKGQTLVAGISIIFAVSATIILLVFWKKRDDELKKGIPLQDERSKKVLALAFAKAFVISIWWLLLIGWLSDGVIEFRDVSQATGAGILGMAVIFALCWLWYNRKDNLDNVRV